VHTRYTQSHDCNFKKPNMKREVCPLMAFIVLPNGQLICYCQSNFLHCFHCFSLTNNGHFPLRTKGSNDHHPPQVTEYFRYWQKHNGSFVLNYYIPCLQIGCDQKWVKLLVTSTYHKIYKIVFFQHKLRQIQSLHSKMVLYFS